MCLALYKPANIKPDWAALEEGMCHNSDGAGFAVAVDGQLIVEKGFFKFADFKKAFEPFGDHAAIVHFRLATHGGKNQQNCHPFALADFGNEAGHMPVAVIHNGIFASAKNDKKEWSDTWHVCRDVLHPLWSGSEKSLISNEMIPLGDSFVGSSNKLVFLYADGSFGIWGEKNGHWSDGVWYSNYSYCSYGARYADPRSRYVYDDGDDYWSGRKNYAIPSKKSAGFEPIVDYAVEATAVELALIDELRDCGFGEDEIEKMYLHRSMAEELANVYQLTVADVMTCAHQRADNEGYADSEVEYDETEEVPDLTALPADFSYVGVGALSKTAEVDGSVLGWCSGSHKWVPAAGILSNMPYAVLRSKKADEMKARKPSRKLPKGYMYLGKGPVAASGPLKDGDLMRWSKGYEMWTRCAGLLADDYIARIGCPAYIIHKGKTISAFRIETGKRYKTRDGRTTSPVTVNTATSSNLYKFAAVIGEDSFTSTFNETGAFSATPTKNDLVAEHESRIQLRVGGRYVTRKGLITLPVEPNGGSSGYPFRAVLTSDGKTVAVPNVSTYQPDGRFLNVADKRTHDNDIVAEYDPSYRILRGDDRVKTGDEVLQSNGTWEPLKNVAPSSRIRADIGLFRRKLPDIEDSYVRLEKGEPIVEGDEFKSDDLGDWLPTSIAGQHVPHESIAIYRRKKHELIIA